MYKHFFGFKESPFQLVPNPKFLFLSKSHKEALAYLNYTISHGDGFVEITGEVGTGKTTLCRAFLEGLEKNAVVAYIFNPGGSSMDLFRAINGEFGIPADGDTARDLIDALNDFLIEKKSRDKNVIILIDESQNLSIEALEQLRLLSNLETDTSKLLQIILVGQPELRKMLDSFSLRQFAQRITLSWNLPPLSSRETREYIRHRVNVASGKRGDRFTQSAYRAIYNYSRGIPRLINIACDRALLTAYGLDRHTVTASIARTSLKELRTRWLHKQTWPKTGRIATVVLAFLCVTLLAVLFSRWNSSPQAREMEIGETRMGEKNTGKRASETQKIKKMKNSAGALSLQKSKPKAPTSAFAPENPVHFGDFLDRISSRPSRHVAMKTAMALWDMPFQSNRHLGDMDNDGLFFQLAASQNSFQFLSVDRDLNLVKRLNLPAILEFYPSGSVSPRYLTVVKMNDSEIILKGGQKESVVRVSLGEMDAYWTGTAYILWKNFFNYEGAIPRDAPKESVVTLKMLLRDIGFDGIKINAHYDKPAKDAVRAIQEKHGIGIDGIVGAKTKIVIYNENKELKIPHIWALNTTLGRGPGEASPGVER